MTSSQPQMQLDHDDHEAWEHFRSRIVDGATFEHIAAELGVEVEHLIHWANWIYKPVKKRAPSQVQATRTPEMRSIERLPKDSAAARRFMAWRRQREGARAALEAFKQ